MSHPSYVDYYYFYYNSRRLLLHLHPAPTTSSAPPPNVNTNSHDQSENYSSGNKTFDSNVVMVLSVLLCALICSLGLNSIIRCALKCYTWTSSNPNGINPRLSARHVNTGVKKKALKTFPVFSYSCEHNLPRLDSMCAICLSEFGPGDQVRLLPKCNHGFHARCIDKWLSSHSSCPTCRQCLLQTCQKIVGGCNHIRTSEAGSTSILPEMIQVMVVPIQVEMPPLEPEGPVCELRGVSQSVS